MAAAALGALVLCLLLGAPAAANPPVLWQVPEDGLAGAGAGRLFNSRGMATDPANGHIFLTDSGNNRVNEFNAWGAFVRAWGFGVRDGSLEAQVCTAESGCQAGIAGTRDGQLQSPEGIAVDASGNVYVAENTQVQVSKSEFGGTFEQATRVQAFDPEGDFLEAWGDDVVASGPDDSATDERQQVAIAATAGSFRLKLFNPFPAGGNEATAPIPYNASAAEVKAALEALPIVGGQGGSVAVTGGPGNPTASNPYQITFEGALGGDQIPQLMVDTSVQTVGAQLTCSTVTAAKTISYRWLRNGEAIAGATAAAYTTVAADAGKVLQCQVTATNANAGSTQVANPFLVAPQPGTAPPVYLSLTFPVLFVGQSAPLTVGGAGGQTLTCNPGSWSGSPSFSYRWYRNGAPIAGATASTYTVTTEDLAAPATFQCAVTAVNAGGAVTAVSGNSATSPAPSEPSAPVANATATASVVGTVSTLADGGGAEICKAAAGDSCKAAAAGSGDGEFGATLGSLATAYDPTTDSIWVGDKGRIQRFSTAGAYLSQIPTPEGAATASLAADPVSGDLYFTPSKEKGTSVLRLDPAGGTVLATLPAPEASRIATGSGGQLYAIIDCSKAKDPEVEKKLFCRDLPSVQEEAENEVIGYDASGKAIPGMAVGDRFLVSPRNLQQKPSISFYALGTGTGCNQASDDLYVGSVGSDRKQAYLSAYGPSPDPAACPVSESAPPQVVEQYTGSIGSEEAVVRAKVNPHRAADATYYVQYGTAACEESDWEQGCQEKPLPPGALLGGAGETQPVDTAGVVLSGLQPGTAYRFRFVVTSAENGGPVFGEGDPECALDPHCGAGRGFTTFPLPPAHFKEDCPNQAFRTGPSASLPDCRAFEMVSPVDKNGGEIRSFGAMLEQSAVDGDGFTYGAEAAFAEPQGSSLNSQYLASRGEGGWSNRSLSPQRGVENICDNFRCKLQNEFKAFSPDLCQSWLIHITDPPLAPGAPKGYVNLYKRSNCGSDAGAYEAISMAQQEPASPSLYWPEVQGASSAGSCTVFRTKGRLTEDAPPAGESYRLYEGCGGQPRFLCHLPDGKASSAQCSAGTPNDPVSNGNLNQVTGAVSADGSRVFWSTSVSAGVPGTLYLRVNSSQAQSSIASGKCSEAAKACTYPVSGLVSADKPARFWDADPQGELALFSVGETLYEFDTREEGGEILTEATPVAGGFKGLLGASTDLSRAYLISDEALTGEAQADKPNLYLAEEGDLAFVATLAKADQLEGGSPVAVFPVQHLSRVSPDGTHLAFMSRGSLTGYDNTDQVSGKAEGEVYLYDASAEGGTGSLACASCNPSGARPVGREVNITEFTESYPAAGWVAPAVTQLYQPRYLSDDGARLFFNSFEALVPRDTNGRTDVYEWESADSKAGCEEAIGGELYLAADHGCLSLISSGQSAQDSSFLDADPSGEDVFLNTGQSLLPQDPGLLDVYVARAGGGFPPPPGAPAGCEGEACQSPPEAPNDPTPASESFFGAGNVSEGAPEGTATRCGRGKVKRKGHCVARKHHKHGKAKRRAEHGRRAER